MAKKQYKKAKRAAYTKRKNASKEVVKQVSKVVEDKKTEDKVQELTSTSEKKENIIIEKKAEVEPVLKTEEKPEIKQEENKIEHTIRIPTINVEPVKKSSLIDLLIKPKQYISSLNSEEMSLTSNLVHIFIKHAISVIGIVFFLTSLLNETAFSIARLNFTQASYLWFRITIFLFIAEVISSYVFSFVMKKVDKVNALFYCSHKTGLITMILMNVLGIIFFINPSIGIMLFCLIFIDLVYIKSSTFIKVFELKEDSILWSTELYYFLFILCFLICAMLFLNDLNVIFKALI